MSLETNPSQAPYHGLTFKGEAYSFPVFDYPIMGNHQERTDFYRSSSDVDRTFGDYCDAFGFDLEVFKGRRILDLGAGRDATFAKEARERGLNVVSVNPNWHNTQSKGELAPWRCDTVGDGASVAALAQELPFKDESFDVVLSLWGVPAYLPGTKSEYVKTFTEINRVLTPGGMAIMYPVPKLVERQPAFGEVLDKCFDNYALLGPFSKLFVVKDEQPGQREIIKQLCQVMNRHTELFLW